ncbi:MAG TPA: flavin reductase [bacterium]
MERNPIPLDNLTLRPYDLFANRWLLLACGRLDEAQFNVMTVAWGSIGQMWDKPFVQVVVRPTRYTFEFMERFPTFTLSSFSEKYRPVLNLLGSKSGRDGDKMKESGLTPMPSRRVEAPSFHEADLVFECRKMYWADFDATHFIDPETHRLYPKKDYHRVYFGEILAAEGCETYRS